MSAFDKTMMFLKTMYRLETKIFEFLNDQIVPKLNKFKINDVIDSAIYKKLK